MRLHHVITGLHVGGAEMMLLKTTSALRQRAVEQSVSSLLEPGPVGRMIADEGIAVRGLDLAVWRIPVQGPRRWRHHVDRLAPDLVMAWMYHACLLAVAGAGRGRQRLPLIWNIRHSLIDLREEKGLTRIVIGLCARLSSRTEAVVYNSRSAAVSHERAGFDPGKTVVIPNGFDTERFHPAAADRDAVRRELAIPPGARVVGFVGRFHPHKDPANLISAFARVHARAENVVLVCTGRGMTADNPRLQAMLPPDPVRSSLYLLGERDDVDRLMRAFDCLVLSSRTESFPNVVGEAMSTGVPCVVTAVGDAAELVGDTGLVVPPQDSSALAAAVVSLLDKTSEQRRHLGQAARRIIAERFALGRIADLYLELCQGILEQRGSSA